MAIMVKAPRKTGTLTVLVTGERGFGGGGGRGQNNTYMGVDLHSGAVKYIESGAAITVTWDSKEDLLGENLHRKRKNETGIWEQGNAGTDSDHPERGH